MKSIENKQTDITVKGEEGTEFKADYADLISIFCLRFPKQGGLDYTEMENRIEIGKSVKMAKAKDGSETKDISMEDAYFKYLQSLVKSMKWAFWHEDLLKFRDDILAVK
jgi:hypothetical protein